MKNRKAVKLGSMLLVAILLTALLSFTFSQFAFASYSQNLFFSEYIEGSSNNKAVEIFNGTSGSISMSQYSIDLYYNGSSTSGATITLSGTLPSGSVYVVANTSASSSILSKANLTSGSLNFNGNDAVVLKNGSTVLDVIGQIGYDPGTEWGTGNASTCDNTLVRNSNIMAGDTNGSDSFDPSSQWTGYATDTFTYLGSHTTTWYGGSSTPTPAPTTTATPTPSGTATPTPSGTATPTPSGTATPTPPAVDNDNIGLGNPSGATTDTSNSNNYLMVKPQYDLSYNNSKHEPNWTSWHLYSADIGSTDRQDDFRADTTLPSGWYEVGASEFSGSGFDRGHMCPSADRTSSVSNNSATFLMTNMLPQAPNNNQITWADLENYLRTLVTSGNELYIISGGYGSGGTGSSGYMTTVGNGVVVPSKTWKIAVVLPNGNNDISRITTSTRVIAVCMPNDQTCNSQPWGNYRVSVDYIESLTGYDFLSSVPASIQNAIEASVDNGPTN